MSDSKRLLLAILKLSDLALSTLSFGAATMAVAFRPASISLTQFLSVKVKLWNCIAFVAMVLCWHIIFVLCDLYDSRHPRQKRTEAIAVMRATMLATVTILLFAKMFTLRMITSSFAVVFCLCCFALLTGTRWAARAMLALLRKHDQNVRYVLILGTNSRAIEFARTIESRPELGYKIIGFIDDDWPGTVEFLMTRYPLRCNFDGLSNYLRHNVVDEVASFLPLRSFHEHLCRLATLFEQHGITMRFDCDIFNLKIARSRADVFEGTAQITAQSGGAEGSAILFKRAIDIVIASSLLILLAPLFAIVAISILVTSPGPVFFSQKRVGLNKRQFLMYKFRTMVPNAEKLQEKLLHLNEQTGPVFKIRNDPRVTRLGKFLRKTSIDELPQLLNVLRGDMSLVGPRAMSVRDYRFFSEDWQRRRFSVRPGITCLWQVNGRSSLPFERWMELDMQYIDRWSLWLDLKILAQTIPAVLRGTGAA